MLSWITGPRLTNAIEDIKADPAYESTFIDPPETPAHQFAVKAFKHAIFGTPAAENANNPRIRSEKKAKVDAMNPDAPEIPPPKENALSLSPSKQPGGIMRTPQTASKNRKTVSFGSQVVDNEARRNNLGRSGIPNDCPGKFPSPWTPGTELKLESNSGKKPRTKLTAAFLEARTTPQAVSTQKPKARDDSDITMDMSTPRSESGKYWKAEYESYAENSEREMKKLVAKQQLAKNYAKKKDSEVNELATKLSEERKRFKQKEQELQEQNKDFQERLRQAMAETASASIEIASLKARIATLETSSSQNNRVPFQIYEDLSKDASKSHSTIAASSQAPPFGKENSPLKSRSIRRQTLPATSSRPTSSHETKPKIGTGPGEASIILGRSPRVPALFSELPAQSTLTVSPAELPAKFPPSIRNTELSRDDFTPKSPVGNPPSSPLPQPSPDPWMAASDSPPELNRMAFPLMTGPSYSRPARSTNPKPSRRTTKPAVQEPKAEAPRACNRIAKSSVVTTDKPDASKLATAAVENSMSWDTGSKVQKASKSTLKNAAADVSRLDNQHAGLSSAGSRYDAAEARSHYANESSRLKKDRARGRTPEERKEQARKRLEERKRGKLTKA